MGDLFWRTCFVIVQAIIGLLVFGNDIWQRLRTGRGALRFPAIDQPKVFLTDVSFWFAVALWVALGVSWFFVPGSREALLPIAGEWDNAAASLGFALALAGLALIHFGLRALGRQFRTSIDYGEQTRLVTHGIYRHLRNPMALGLMLQGWALLLMHQTWAALGTALLLHLANRLRVHFEEERLRVVSGSEYANWCLTSGRFLPRWRKRQDPPQFPRSGRSFS